MPPTREESGHLFFSLPFPDIASYEACLFLKRKVVIFVPYFDCRNKNIAKFANDKH